MAWLWIPFTIGASFFQALRTALQKHLKGVLSTNGSSFTRFCFGAPFAVLYVAALMLLPGATLPTPNHAFFAWCLVGSVTQIVATSLLVHVLGLRNFPVGIAYSKTEIVQAALFSVIFLGDRLSLSGWAAVAVATLGVMLVSVSRDARAPGTLLGGLTEAPALIGMASGAFFAVAAVGFRGAALELDHPVPYVAAGYTLAWANVLQTVLMGGYLAWREPGQFAAIGRAWRSSVLSGLTSAAGSACWFTAFALQTVAYVRTLGLLELVFTFMFSVVWFRERPRMTEAAGVALLAVGILLLLNPF